MDIVSYALHFNQNHSVLIAVLILFAIFPMAVIKKRPYLGIAMILLGGANFGFNGELNRWYVNQHGVRGTGSVTAIRASSVNINNKPQSEFDVLLKVKDGQIIKSSFNSYDDIFASDIVMERPAPLPQVGEEFTTLYLPGDLKNFVIIADDLKSSYGKRVICSDLKLRAAKALTESDCGL